MEEEKWFWIGIRELTWIFCLIGRRVPTTPALSASDLNHQEEIEEQSLKMDRKDNLLEPTAAPSNVSDDKSNGDKSASKVFGNEKIMVSV